MVPTGAARDGRNVPMRTARSLLAGAALTACLAIAAPAAHATGAVNEYDPSGSSSSTSTDSSTDSGYLKHQEKVGGEETLSDTEGQRPHGGIHTGGGGLSLTGGSSLAAGSVLLAGGLGAGAWALRRRRGTAGAGAVA
jgi:hypothetical protein